MIQSDGGGDPVWRRSSYCDSGACLEVAILGDRVLLRQSEHADQHLEFTHREWWNFLEYLREIR